MASSLVSDTWIIILEFLHFSPILTDESPYRSRKMDASEKEVKESRKRGWLLPMLMLGVVGLLTSSVVVMVFFYSDLQQLCEQHAEVYLFNSLLVGFVILALVFMGYLILKELGSKKLKTDLQRQKITSQLLERRVTELEAVHELTSLVNSEMALSEILDNICSKALRTLGADQSSLFLYDPEIGKLRCLSLSGPQNDLVKNAVVEVGKSIAGWVIKHGKPLYLDRDTDERRFNGFVNRDKKISSSLCLPLMVKNETRGVLNLTLFDSKRKFAQSDVKLASIYAENAAIAIDKTGLYQKLKKQTKTMKNVIKELKATQDRSVDRETLRALSNLATGMAHHFSGTLVAILEKIQLVLKEIEGTSVPENAKRNVLRLLRMTEQLAASGSETAKHIRTFAGTFQEGSGKPFEELDINAIVREAVEATGPKWKDEAQLRGTRIEIRTDLKELSNPLGNRLEIKDVLTSMIYNSIEALPNGGKIKIATGMRDDEVEIKINDNGMGMSEQVKARIFEPFFSTKYTEEEGRGIGLSVAQDIVSRHNGRIEVESEPDAGSTFIVTLPARGGKKAEVRSEAEAITPAAL